MKIDKRLALLLTKTVSGVLGGALVLTEDHPYIALFFLAVGAAANETIMYLDKK